MLGSYRRSTVLVFADESSLICEISSGLKQNENLIPLIVPNWSEFDQALKAHELSMVLFVLKQGRTRNEGADSAQFNQVISRFPRIRGIHANTQIILLTVCNLSIEQNCQAAMHGASAILNTNAPDFRQNLLQYLDDCHERYLDLTFNSKSILDENDQEQLNLYGSSRALVDVVTMARKAAKVSDAPVIITGESGTGKQRLAEIIHRFDEKRSRHPFVCVNCAAITGSLAESELFGHAKGAFTGATEDRRGYFRFADGGTIMLDEIGELPLALQPKILRVAQEGLVLPVGSDREYPVDVRIIAATHRNLEDMIHKGEFRLDLYQRLNVIHLKVPPLRQRTEDIPVLFQSFLKKYSHYCACEISDVDPVVYEVLAKSIGSGNVRELENLVRQILVFKDRGHRIEVSDLPHEVIRRSMVKHDAQMKVIVSDDTIDALSTGSKSLAEVVEEYEKYMLARLVERGYSQTDIADNLGITRRTLYNKLQKYDLR